MEHTNEWDDIRGWQAKREGLRRQWEAELRRKEQVVQVLPPLPLRVIPLPWEDLASLLCRTAREMGYERPHWLLYPEHIAYRIDPAALPLIISLGQLEIGRKPLYKGSGHWLGRLSERESLWL